MKYIYLDNAAATPLGRAASKAMRRADSLVGNPWSLHGAGRDAASVLAQARAGLASFLGARTEEVVFTASGSESNTIAVLRLAEAHPRHRHIVATAVEHKSVLQACDALTRRGYDVTVVPVDGQGRVNPDAVIAAVRKDTLLVSVMYANNEIGTIMPICDIGRRLKRMKREQRRAFPLLHTDACQAAAYLPMNVQDLCVDLLTMNSSKVYGPRGVAALYVRSGISLSPQVLGGPHEGGLRAGTENVPAIAGFAAAVAEINPAHARRVASLRDRILTRLPGLIPDIRINGPAAAERIASNAHFSVAGVTGEQVTLELDKYGIAVGAGAACTSQNIGPTHVLKAINIPRRFADGAVRVSLGRLTSRRDIDRLLAVLPDAVQAIRRRNRF